MERAALPTGRRWAACKLILGGGDRRDRFRWNWTDIARACRPVRDASSPRSAQLVG